MRNLREQATEAGGLPPEVLELPIRGLGLQGKTLGEELARGETLLVFLRHFG